MLRPALIKFYIVYKGKPLLNHIKELLSELEEDFILTEAISRDMSVILESGN